MKTKNRNPALLLQGKKVDPIIEFYFELNHLKQLFRQGWLLKGIPENKCESVADHLFGMCILSLVISENYFPNLDIMRLLEIALVHELGEIYLGDVTPHDHIPKSTKHEWELKAVIEIFSKITNGKHYIALWKEYEEGVTLESQLVRQIDYMEMAFQAVIYEHQYQKDLQEFFNFNDRKLKNKILLSLYKEIKGLRYKSNTSQK
jgi:putative hydrolase of HD superfamily